MRAADSESLNMRYQDAQVAASNDIMCSFKPSGDILEVLATYMRFHKVIACVGKDWAQAVKAMKKDLRRKFLNSKFDVECLGHLDHSGPVLERRLSRVVHKQIGDCQLDDKALWWYRTQLYLSLYIERNRTSFQGILRQCYEYSEFRGYNFSMFEDLYRIHTAHCLDRPLHQALFRNSRYVKARDLGCATLGTSIDEVLRTLICVM